MVLVCSTLFSLFCNGIIFLFVPPKKKKWTKSLLEERTFSILGIGVLAWFPLHQVMNKPIGCSLSLPYTKPIVVLDQVLGFGFHGSSFFVLQVCFNQTKTNNCGRSGVQCNVPCFDCSVLFLWHGMAYHQRYCQGFQVPPLNSFPNFLVILWHFLPCGHIGLDFGIRSTWYFFFSFFYIFLIYVHPFYFVSKGTSCFHFPLN